MIEAEIQAMLEVMRHAVLADGQVHQKEIEILKRVSKSLGVEITPESENKSLHSLEEIFSKIKNKEMRAQALIMSLEIVSASGEVREAERSFLRKACELSGLSDEDTEKFIKIAENIAQTKAELYSLLNKSL
ncbi:MAG: TerB family tellurite resistance protein [Aquificaceae bacterium]